MKVVSLFLLLSTLIITAQEIKFETKVIDYGNIKLNSDGKRVFKFKNIGDFPVIIKNVKGDPMAYFPQKPIFPGEEGQIEIGIYTGNVCHFSQAVTVYSNAKRERIILKVKGRVVKKEEK